MQPDILRVSFPSHLPSCSTFDGYYFTTINFTSAHFKHSYILSIICDAGTHCIYKAETIIQVGKIVQSNIFLLVNLGCAGIQPMGGSRGHNSLWTLVFGKERKRGKGKKRKMRKKGRKRKGRKKREEKENEEKRGNLNNSNGIEFVLKVIFKLLHKISIKIPKSSSF